MPQPGVETHGFNTAMTTPNFGPPILQAPHTIPFDKAKQKRTLVVVLGMVIFLIVAMVGLGIGLMFWAKDRPARVSIQSPPPGNPPVNSDLIYPGSTVNLRFSNDEGKKVLQLRTDDPSDDVTAWYEEKISPTGKIRLPGVGTTLTDGATTVVITEAGEGTQIILTQK